jgi:hypothetical protein
MPLSTLSFWKDYFRSKETLSVSNSLLSKLRDAVGPSMPFLKSFDEISKNDGIAFLSLDPSETQLQLFHHSSVLGGTWTCPTYRLVAVLGFDHSACPIQIAQKSVKDIKTKSHTMTEFATALETSELFENMKAPKLEFQFKNIIPIPVLLVQTFMSLNNTSLYSVARAFLDAMFEFDAESSASPVPPEDSTIPILLEENEDEKSIDQGANQDSSLQVASNANQATESIPSFLGTFIHVIQFCHLCVKGKIPPVHYSIATTPDIDQWFTSLQLTSQINTSANSK